VRDALRFGFDGISTVKPPSFEVTVSHEESGPGFESIRPAKTVVKTHTNTSLKQRDMSVSPAGVKVGPRG
jgi:hypothetical protein